MAEKKRYSYDYNKAQKHLDKLNASMDTNYSWWKPEQGDNVIRILPPASEDADFPYEEVFLHYGIDDVPITCLGSKCPICAFIKQSGKSKQFKQIRKARRLFFQIIDRDMEVPEPMIWSAGSGFLQYFLPVFLDVDEYEDVTDYEDGTDFVISRKGTGLKTKYNYRIKRNPSAVSEDKEELAEIMEDMVDLSTISKKLNVDEVDDLLQDYLSDKDIDEDFFDEDEAPQRRKRKRKKAKREVEEEEEEEEEKPKSSSRKKSNSSKSNSKSTSSRKTRSTKTESEDEGDEEEEPDETEDEPEEEKAPKKRPRKKKQVDPEEEEEDEPKEKRKKKAKSKSSSSNEDLLDTLLEELDGELADEVDDDDDE
jgi:hypothetical protein